MADYDIGQYRFNGTGCLYAIDSNKSYQSINISSDATDEEATTYFQDLLIRPNNGTFDAGIDYYLYLKIPQDMNYQMNFTVRLVKMTENGVPDSNEFQHVKNLSLSRGGTASNAYNVALYETKDGQIKAMRPEPWNKSVRGTKDTLYYDEPTDTYKLWVTGTTYETTDKVNDVMMTASWKESQSGKFGTFQCIFRPVESGFDAILIQMTRTAEDYNIQRTVNGMTEYGRKIDIDSFDYELYSMQNLVENMSGVNAKEGLSRIGIWGHSEMLMAINGEEIRIGRSGYYELDALNVTSIGIVAKNNDYTNNFTIDYEYALNINTTKEKEE